jgi:hypothetical protein
VGSAGGPTSIATGSDGLGLIAFADSALKVAHCNGLTCSSATTSTVDSDATDVSATIGADGLALIGYRSSGALKVAHCSNAACSASIVTTVDPVGDTGFAASATVGVDGLGLIGYWDASTNALEVAHCSNVLCIPYTRSR